MYLKIEVHSFSFIYETEKEVTRNSLSHFFFVCVKKKTGEAKEPNEKIVNFFPLRGFVFFVYAKVSVQYVPCVLCALVL
jgi:hypothetical protein